MRFTAGISRLMFRVAIVSLVCMAAAGCSSTSTQAAGDYTLYQETESSWTFGQRSRHTRTVANTESRADGSMSTAATKEVWRGDRYTKTTTNTERGADGFQFTATTTETHRGDCCPATTTTSFP